MISDATGSSALEFMKVAARLKSKLDKLSAAASEGGSGQGKLPRMVIESS